MMNRFSAWGALSCILLCALHAYSQGERERQVLTIEKMFSLLEENDKALRPAQEGVKGAQEGLKEAKNARLPDVSASLSFLYIGDGWMSDRDFGNGANAAQSASDIHAASTKVAATPSQQTIQPQKEIHIMKKRFNVEGMMCDHCRAHVEKALNSIEGVKAVVTLSPAEAEVEFTNGEKSLEELQSVVTEKAGDYRLSEK